MGQVYVAVDLETTGFNPDRDAIIELGAVRFRDGEILEEFSQVVNPGRAIPRAIQQLTGISQREADGAPDLSQVASRFRTFIGDAPLVGHNIEFDASFLRSNNLYRFNDLIDTWELALIVLQGLPSYKLGRVAEHFGIDLENAHRAFDDALATYRIFAGLCELGAALPAETLRQINKLAEKSDWSLRGLFVDFERESAQRWGQTRPQGRTTTAGPLFDRFKPLEPLPTPQPLDVDDLASMLEPSGRFASRFENYEYRPPQVEMLRATATAFNQSQHLMIEAGTGTGKSLAYLIPSLVWAEQTGQRVVVSSNTINLQDQLYNKDLPDLHEVLPFDFKVAVMKGRSNYLCPRRLKNLLQRVDLSDVEISVLARVLSWMPNTETGDQGEITLVNARERAVWQRICSDSLTCSPTRCADQSGQPCFFYRARRKAEEAHIIIINHALLLADVAVENRVLPAYQYLVVDEAHHLEDAATNALSIDIDHAGFVARLRDLAPTSAETKAVGLLSDLATVVRNACPLEKAQGLIDITSDLAEMIPSLDVRMFECFDALNRFLDDPDGGRNDNRYDVRVRVTSGTRVQPAWVDVEITWDNLALVLKRFNVGLANLIGALEDLSNYRIEGVEDLEADLQSAAMAFAEVYAVMDQCVLSPDANTIYWLRRSQYNGLLTVHSAPLHVGSLIERHIFLPRDTVILTSATLQTSNSFDYLRERLGATDAEAIALESPFDYHKAALVYLPTDMPEPNQPAYQAKVEEAILGLSLATEGRLLALFTSYAQMQRTAEALRPSLDEAGLTLYVQGEGGSRAQILDAFKETEGAVLMGTRSFWEGVDVQGDALSALVIARLPFTVPTDPIVSARSETFDSPFYQYSIPEAVLGLRQGFGRLIRSANDRGICVILDKRVISKSYGRMFLDALPDCTVQRGPLGELPLAGRRWLAGDMSKGNGSAKPKAKPAIQEPEWHDSGDFAPQPPPPEFWE
ncbi:MAG: DEAD/DEAH box helicase family protein [Caldilineales bacterium]|nr:DEAD/DEAH box helicase family protein [Caldilineales bacterium]